MTGAEGGRRKGKMVREETVSLAGSQVLVAVALSVPVGTAVLTLPGRAVAQVKLDTRKGARIHGRWGWCWKESWELWALAPSG